MKLPTNREEMLKVFCPTGEGGGIDPTCSPADEYVARPDETVGANNPRIKRDPVNKDNVMLYHATKKIGIVDREGLKQSEPGVIKPGGFKAVFFAHTPKAALAAGKYEEELRQRVQGRKPSLGDFWIVEASIPIREITVRANGDITVGRNVRPDEIKRKLSRKEI